MTDPEILTTREAVKYLRTTKQTLLTMVHQGRIKGNKIGRGYRFLKKDLLEYISQIELSRSQ